MSVLGTHFNINSYADEGSVKTTLLEGAVRIYTRSGLSLSLQEGDESILLKPGQQSVLKAEAISVDQVNTTEAVAWKDGYFRFNNENLASIMRKLEKWYDIEVTIPESLGKKEFTGKISRNKNISRVLKMLEKTNGVHFKIEGRRVVAIE
ncbi:hypothetical protein D3C86_1569200 [compost metagenome]